MSNDEYWEGSDVDAEHAGVADGWGRGGVFGRGAVEAAEVLVEVEAGPFDNGRGGVRDRPGYGNLLGAQEAIARRQQRAVRRASMLVIERMVDELPDLRDKLLEAVPLWRNLLAEKILPAHEARMDDRETPVGEAVGARLKDEAVSLLAAIYRRAYEMELRRTQAAVKLGAFEADDWALDRAFTAVAKPKEALAGLAARARATIKRAKQIVHGLTAPEPEESPTTVEIAEEDS